MQTPAPTPRADPTLEITVPISASFPVSIRTLDDVRAVVAAWRWIISKPPLSLELPFLAAQLQRSAEKRLNFWRNVCGCQLGAFAFLAALGWRTALFIKTPEWTWPSLGVHAAVVLASAVAGKIVAILISRFIVLLELQLLSLRVTRAHRHHSSP